MAPCVVRECYEVGMAGHLPVLGVEAIAALCPHDGGLYVDATFGGGGYSRALLRVADCRVVALDCDPEAAFRAQDLLREEPEHFSFRLCNFKDWALELSGQDCQGVVFDLGVSSFQLDEGVRGFSFQRPGPLDMRMAKEGMSAADVVNTFSQEQLTEVIKFYGEERYAHRVASAIIKARKEKPLTTTDALAEVVRSCVPKQGMIDPATKTFQALRIFVNDELRNLQQALEGVETMLNQGPSTQIRVVTVAFHSLEDRIVKNWIRGVPAVQQERDAEDLTRADRSGLVWTVETNRVVVPSAEEIQRNPRSRSARLRAVTVSKASKPSQQIGSKLSFGSALTRNTTPKTGTSLGNGLPKVLSRKSSFDEEDSLTDKARRAHNIVLKNEGEEV